MALRLGWGQEATGYHVIDIYFPAEDSEPCIWFLLRVFVAVASIVPVFYFIFMLFLLPVLIQ